MRIITMGELLIAAAVSYLLGGLVVLLCFLVGLGII